MLPLYPTSLEAAKVSKARTQKIRRFSGKIFNHHYQQEKVIGDKGYRGCEFVKVCESKVEKRDNAFGLPLWVCYRL